MKNKVITKLYCCSVTAEYELFETKTILYTSVAKLKKAHSCYKYCGITEITLTAKSIIKGRKEKFK
jgi:hypothetical protein